MPPGLTVDVLESAEEGAEMETLHGDTSHPYACQMLGGMAREANSVLVWVPEDDNDTDHGLASIVADVEFYYKRNCGGPVMTRFI